MLRRKSVSSPEEIDHLLAAIDRELVRRQKSDPEARFTQRFCFNFKGDTHFPAGIWAKERRAGATSDEKVLQRREKLTKSQRAHLDRLYDGKRGSGRVYKPTTEEALAELSRYQKVMQRSGLRLTKTSKWVPTWGQTPWAGGRWASNRSASISDTTHRAKLTDAQRLELDTLYAGESGQKQRAASPRLPPQPLLTSAPPLPLSPPDLSSQGSAHPGPGPGLKSRT